MTKAMGPFSFSYWDEIGLLVEGFDALHRERVG
jgi:hypothetical protein